MSHPSYHNPHTANTPFSINELYDLVKLGIVQQSAVMPERIDPAIFSKVQEIDMLESHDLNNFPPDYRDKLLIAIEESKL